MTHYISHVCFQTILLGDSGVGKTSLLVQFDTGRFQPGNFAATVGIGFTVSNTALWHLIELSSSDGVVRVSLFLLLSFLKVKSSEKSNLTFIFFIHFRQLERTIISDASFRRRLSGSISCICVVQFIKPLISFDNLPVVLCFFFTTCTHTHTHTGLESAIASRAATLLLCSLSGTLLVAVPAHVERNYNVAM